MIFDKDYYEDVDFSDIDSLPESIGRVRFVRCRFNGLSFIDTKLLGTIFEDCSLNFTRISGTLDRCAFTNCSFRYANLLGAHFDGCKMTGSTLSDISQSGFLITGGDWSYTELSKVRIKKHNVGDVNFTCANLFDCSFESCNLRGARFTNAVVNGLCLKNSNISGAQFEFVNFGQINFKGCTADFDFAVMFTRAHGIRI